MARFEITPTPQDAGLTLRIVAYDTGMVTVGGIPYGEHNKDSQDRVWELAEAGVLEGLKALRAQAAKRQATKEGA
jgi:hypothetical protein